ncbi:MAG: DUF4304 domain-containing protein [Proteobacteria bacterium]|nr:DUF4304 domain-containing protein [Pseudomonadota bacterium]
MPTTENELLQSWFAPLFKAAGFKKSASTWHRATQDIIHVFNIQGSQWRHSCYFKPAVTVEAYEYLGIKPA